MTGLLERKCHACGAPVVFESQRHVFFAMLTLRLCDECMLELDQAVLGAEPVREWRFRQAARDLYAAVYQGVGGEGYAVMADVLVTAEDLAAKWLMNWVESHEPRNPNEENTTCQ